MEEFGECLLTNFCGIVQIGGGLQVAVGNLLWSVGSWGQRRMRAEEQVDSQAAAEANRSRSAPWPRPVPVCRPFGELSPPAWEGVSVGAVSCLMVSPDGGWLPARSGYGGR